MTEASPTVQPLTEHVSDWRAENVCVDFDRRLVTNVVLSGGSSRNGHRYSEEALRQAAPLYARKPVFLDHAPQPARPFDRSTRDLVGSVLNPRFEDGRLRGDIQVLDTEAGRTFLALIDANHPAVGMSHVVLAQRGGDPQLVERIHDVVSVDAVVFPATTSSFRETTSTDPPASWEALVEQYDAAMSELSQVRQQLAEAVAERDQLREQHRHTMLRDQIDRELHAAGLPEFAVTPAFREQLEQFDDAAARQRLIAERAELARRCRPNQPASQPRGDSAPTSDEVFLRVLRGRV